MISGNSRYWLLGAIFLCTSSLADQNSELEAMMQAMADIKHSRVVYSEEKSMNMLDIPLESKGILEYIAPDTIIREIHSPTASRYEIKGKRITLQQRGKTRVLDLDALPLLRAFVESLRATLAGDIRALREFYTVGFTGTVDQWRLELRPAEAAMRKYVNSIVLQGTNGHIHLFYIEDANGDTTRMKILPIAADEHDG